MLKKTFILIILTLMIFIGVKFALNAAYVPVIVMYHSVDTGEVTGYKDKLTVNPGVFEKQMKFLKENKYNVITLEDFVKMIRNGKRVPHKTLAITFDDGLKNNFTKAYPVLKKYNLPATIFVVTDFIGKENFLSWEDIKAMSPDIITIGSHTMSHSWLPDLDDNYLRKELSGSKDVIEKMTDRKVNVLSYPLGGFNELAKKIVKETGYIGAVTTNPGKNSAANDPYALKRTRISDSADNSFVLWAETSGYYTFIKERRDDD